MSGFHNSTNEVRIQKIIEILALLEKSAASNKATQEEWWELLAPVVNAIQSILDPEARPTQETSPEPTPVASQSREDTLHALGPELNDILNALNDEAYADAHDVLIRLLGS